MINLINLNHMEPHSKQQRKIQMAVDEEKYIRTLPHTEKKQV